MSTPAIVRKFPSAKMHLISSSVFFLTLILQPRAASSATPQKRESSYQHLHPASIMSPQTTFSTSPGLQAPPGTVSYPPAYIPPDRDPEKPPAGDAGLGPQQTNLCPSGTCIDPLDQDSDARYDFERRVGGIVRDVLEEEIGQIIQNMSHQALRRLTDQLLSFTLRGERYLCLNIVSSSSPDFRQHE